MSHISLSIASLWNQSMLPIVNVIVDFVFAFTKSSSYLYKLLLACLLDDFRLLIITNIRKKDDYLLIKIKIVHHLQQTIYYR